MGLKVYGISAVFLLVGCTVMPNPTGEGEKCAEELMRLGDTLYQQKKISQAQGFYEQAVKANSQHVPALISLSRLYHAQGEETKACVTLENALTTLPQNKPLLEELAKLYILREKLIEAERLYRKALEITPQDAMVMNGLGVCYDMMGQHGKAQEVYEKALHLEPDSLEIQSNKALSLGLSGHLDEALTLQRSLLNHPQITPKVHHNLKLLERIKARQDTKREKRK